MPDNATDPCKRCGHKFSKHYYVEGYGFQCTKPNCECKDFKDSTIFNVKSIALGILCLIGVGFLLSSCQKAVGFHDDGGRPAECVYQPDKTGGYYDC